MDIVIPMHYTSAQAWLRDALRAGVLAFVDLGNDDRHPRALYLEDLSGFRQFRLAKRRPARSTSIANDFDMEVVHATASLMAMHTAADRYRLSAPPQRDVVIVGPRHFSDDACSAMDQLVNALIASELVSSAGTVEDTL